MALPKRYVEEKMNEAINNYNTVNFRYQKASDEKYVNREVEPYEVRTERRADGTMMTYLYGYDISKNLKPSEKHIKRWCTGRFSTFKINTNKMYSPRSF